MTKKVLCGFGIDLDAVSSWINTGGRGDKANPTDISRGVFGATVGLDRVLHMLEEHKISATFFVPSHTAESFESQVGKIRDSGHEIGLHGYTHEYVSELSAEQERDVLAKSIAVITNLTGKHPRGWTAPAWSTSKRTINLLEEMQIVYDHSYMHHDCQPYYLPHQPEYIETDLSLRAEQWMKPMSRLSPSSIVEIPANWHLDDWPPMNIGQGVGNGLVDPDVVFKIWKAQFDYFYQHSETFIFPISIHPQVSGKAHVQEMLARFIAYLNGHSGVHWVTFEEMAAQYKSGEIAGAYVEGGAS